MHQRFVHVVISSFIPDNKRKIPKQLHAVNACNYYQNISLNFKDVINLMGFITVAFLCGIMHVHVASKHLTNPIHRIFF